MSEYKSAKKHCQEKPGLGLRIGLSCLLGLLGARVLGAWVEVPVDQVTLQAVSLDLVSAKAAQPAIPGLRVKAKVLPKSVGHYLKNTPLVDSQHPRVAKAAMAILRGLGRSQAKDADALAQAIHVFAAGHLSGPAMADTAFLHEVSDTRQAAPKASAILLSGSATDLGRSRLVIALSRALGLPARSALLNGKLTTQYWAAYAEQAPKDKKAPWGEWRVMGQPELKGWEEAWSLEPSDLRLALWHPEQALAYEGSISVVYYALSESLTARAHFAALSQGAKAEQVLSGRQNPSPEARAGGGEYLRLSVHRATLRAQGVIQPLTDVSLLLPWNVTPHKGVENPGPLSVKQRVSEGLWSDRPSRLRIRDGAFRDEWSSPPPALGMLRYANFGLRRPSRVMYLKPADGGQLSVVVRRADSLAPVAGAELVFEQQGLSHSAKTGSDGALTWQRDIQAKDAALKIFCKDSSGELTDSIYLP